MTPSTNAVRDQLVSDAKSLPDLLNKAQVLDPALFKTLTGGQNKNVWYPAVLSVVSWASTHWLFGWSPDVCAEIAGGILVAGSAVVHWLSANMAKKIPSK